MRIKCTCGKEIHSKLEDINEVCPHCGHRLMIDDKGLIETIRTVLARQAYDDVVAGAAEELVDDFISDWFDFVEEKE